MTVHEVPAAEHVDVSNREVFLRTSFTERALSSASQAGLVNNLNFGLSWGLFPILFAHNGIPVDRIGILVVVYPADDDFNAAILDRMVALAKEGCDIVCASRFMPGGTMQGCP